MPSNNIALTADDDAAAHPIGAELDWRESYYCNFADTESGLHGVAWQGVRPNVGHGEAIFLLYDGDDKLIHSVDPQAPVPAGVGPERTSIGRQRFECVEPWNHWRVHYTADDAEITVDWQRLSKICDWDWWDSTQSKHFQSAGRIRVTGRVGNREIDFSGYGERDRAWGPRNYDPIDFIWFLTVQFTDDVAAHAMVERVGEDYHLRGYLHQDGETRDLVSYACSDIVYAPPGGPMATTRQLLTDDKGRTLELVSNHRWPDYLTFTTEPDGAGLQERDPGNKPTGRFWLTFHTFTRSDGAVGKGMIDNNMRLGREPAEFTAKGPVHSTLYDYGS